jgi:hypothetical protein
MYPIFHWKHNEIYVFIETPEAKKILLTPSSYDLA